MKIKCNICKNLDMLTAHRKEKSINHQHLFSTDYVSNAGELVYINILNPHNKLTKWIPLLPLFNRRELKHKEVK